MHEDMTNESVLSEKKPPLSNDKQKVVDGPN